MRSTFLVKYLMLLFLCVAVCGCKEENSPGLIYGTVTDFATGEPVSNANVMLRPNGGATLTGSDGIYEFLEVPEGEYSITVSKAEYSDLVDDYVIKVNHGTATKRDVQIKKRPVALHLFDNESQEISVLDFGADEGVTKKTFNIFNGGTQKIDYRIEKSVAWIDSISQPNGTIEVGATCPIVVTINRRLLAMGDNTTVLLITSATDGGKELTVKARNDGELPVVSITQPISIDSITYRIKCEVVSDGGQAVTERGICWNTFGDPTLDDDTIRYMSGGLGQYVLRMENLTLSTRYYVRAYAKNHVGVAFSEVVNFRTGSILTPPTVSTVEVSEMTSSSALCTGNVIDDGGSSLVECGVCWGTNANPTLNGSHQATEVASLGVFNVRITGLYSHTTYHARCYAVNTKGTSYGEDRVFTTAEGSPTINVLPQPINGGIVEGGDTYEIGQRCTVTATANTGYQFNNWTENGTVVSGNASYSFIVTGNRTLVANFTVPAQIFTISVSVNPAGSGSFNGAGQYEEGRSCTLTATPATGYKFVNWSENGQVASSDAEYTFTVESNRALVANFALETYSVSVSANPENGGVISGGGNYEYGQECTVTAIAASGFIFTNWTANGETVSSNATYTFTVAGSRTLTANFMAIPEGAINGLFTINDSGGKVYFSQGNLQYIGSAATPYWRFAENQWDYLGDNGQLSASENVDRDFFEWATSGYDHGANCYQPYCMGANSDHYAYANPSFNLYDGDGRADWGYNAIINGGNIEHIWRTLTNEEWCYLLYTRYTGSGIRFAPACVNNVNGFIILPDTWDSNIYPLSAVNSISNYSHYIDNTISVYGWNLFFSSNGAVFLPATGFRNGTFFSMMGYKPNYWTSSVSGSNASSTSLGYTGNSMNRSFGISVRLVQDYKPYKH